MFEKLVSKKFILALLIVTLTMIGLCVGLIGDTSFATIVIAVMGAFGASDLIAQKFTAHSEQAERDDE
jgi:type IV secretory pathway VirB2 component (pilin)